MGCTIFIWHERRAFGLVSFNITGIGQSLALNLTADDLPYNVFREQDFLTDGVSEYRFLNSTFDLRSGYPMAYTEAGAAQSVSARKPFTVMLYEAGATKDDVLEVHFWYRVR